MATIVFHLGATSILAGGGTVEDAPNFFTKSHGDGGQGGGGDKLEQNTGTQE